jgi:hypothetical protein
MTEEQIEKNRIRYGEVYDKPDGGGILGFPMPVIEAMLREQEEQGNTRSTIGFKASKSAGKFGGGFEWGATQEGRQFWDKVIGRNDFDVFFEKYPELLPKNRVEEVVTEEVVTEEALSVDSFIENNKEALQDISKTNTPLFNALNGVLAELRISYEDVAVQVEEVEEVVEVKEDDLDLDNLMGEIDELDLDSLLDDIDDL